MMEPQVERLLLGIQAGVIDRTRLTELYRLLKEGADRDPETFRRLIDRVSARAAHLAKTPSGESIARALIDLLGAAIGVPEVVDRLGLSCPSASSFERPEPRSRSWARFLGA